MAKKKKKQKRKVAPTFNRILGRKAGGELEFEWVLEEIAIGKFMSPLIMTMTSADMDDDDCEAASAFVGSIWEWLTTDSKELRDELEEAFKEIDDDEAIPFYMSKLLPALKEIFHEVFPEGKKKESGKIKRRLSTEDLVVDTFLGCIRKDVLPDDLMELFEQS